MQPHKHRVNATEPYAVSVVSIAPAASHSDLFLLCCVLLANIAITTVIEVYVIFFLFFSQRWLDTTEQRVTFFFLKRKKIFLLELQNILNFLESWSITHVIIYLFNALQIGNIQSRALVKILYIFVFPCQSLVTYDATASGWLFSRRHAFTFHQRINKCSTLCTTIRVKHFVIIFILLAYPVLTWIYLDLVWKGIKL